MTRSVVALEEIAIPSASIVRRFIKTVSLTKGGGPDGAWSVTIELLERIDLTSLDFKFLAFVQKHDQVPYVLDPNELLKPCHIALPNGHYVTNNGKTLIVFYARDKHEEDVAGACLRLRNVIDTMCTEADKKYYVAKYTRLITLR